MTNETDRFEAVGTNPFVATEHDPFSTFAVDVDTASYDILRRDIGNRMLPQPQSVRLEEYVNYFKYDYPAPETDANPPFAITLAAAPHILDAPTTVLRVGIQASKPEEFVKKPTNVVFLVDVSGSMATPEKLPVVKVLLQHTVEVLDREDTVSVVTYASGAQVLLGPTKVSDAATIVKVIDSLAAGGSTNGAGGIQLAYQQARAAYKDGGINHVVMCTDGDFNVGAASDSELLKLIRNERKTGVTLTALGFGTGNLNDSMMEKVSNAGNGIYAVINSAEYARTYAEDRILATLHHVAKDVKIQVEFNPKLVAAYRLLGYEDRAIADQDFRDDTVDAGEIGAGHRVTALYELVLAGDEVPMPKGAKPIKTGAPVDLEREIDAKDLVLVKVRYKGVDATEMDEASEVSETLKPAQIAKSYRDSDRDLQWAIAVGAFAEILKGSPYAANKQMDLIESITTAQADRDPDREEFTRLLSAARTLMR
jgi:Ca-activated chloride channel family protein